MNQPLPTAPILFIAFNRPNQTLKSFDTIRATRPRQLFVACDGPRTGKPGEKEGCEQVRQIATTVDWDCELHTLFQNENLGCEIAVSKAITWFFSKVEAGIILEDDCVPNASFYRFCTELLSYYADNPAVGCITGNNFQRGKKRGFDSYYFSKHFHCWGWASWRRAWKHFDHSMTLPSGMTDENIIGNFTIHPSEIRIWTGIFDRLRSGQLNTWDYRWVHALWHKRMLTATPQQNLVKNIGFDSLATHTSTSRVRTPAAKDIRFPLIHPNEIGPLDQADLCVTRQTYGLTLTANLKRSFRKLACNLRLSETGMLPKT